MKPSWPPGSFRLGRPWLALTSSLLLAASLGACVSSEGPPSHTTGTAGTGAAGSNAAGTTGAAGMGAAGTGAAGTGAAGTNAAGMGAAGTGVAGSGAAGTGAAGAGVAGTGAAGAGAAGAGAAGAGSAGAGSATMGTQDDPGMTGDGKFTHMAPYALPPEAMALMNGAPKGQLLGPMNYTVKNAYTNWQTTWTFRYWIYVPAQYKPGKRAALHVFQDAIHYIQDPLHYMGPKVSDAQFYTPTVFDNLIHEGAMPVTIGLFVDPGEPPDKFPYTGNEGPNRGRQYDTPNDQYVKFLVEELIPTALKDYAIVEDPDGWAITGHSSGGIAAFLAGWYRPDKFRKLLTHSASFPNTGGMFPNLINTTTPAKPLRVYLLSGTADLGNGSWFNSNTTAAMYLGTKGYHYRFASGTDMHFPPKAGTNDFPAALRWMWRGYHTPP